jgi:hypothetical protein
MKDYGYKIQQLLLMLEFEENQPDKQKYGAHLTHWSGTASPINIDAGAIECLIEYYQMKNER